MADEIRTPSFRDTLAAAQLQVERQLCGLLCAMPAMTLSVSAPFVPEIGQRERIFWQKARLLDVSHPDLPDLFFQVVVEGDFYDDIRRWQYASPLNDGPDSYFHPFSGVSEDYIRGKLFEVKTLQAARRGMEILSQHPEWVERGIYAG